jgi:hypothetical protein
MRLLPICEHQAHIHGWPEAPAPHRRAASPRKMSASDQLQEVEAAVVKAMQQMQGA